MGMMLLLLNNGGGWFRLLDFGFFKGRHERLRLLVVLKLLESEESLLKVIIDKKGLVRQELIIGFLNEFH